MKSTTTTLAMTALCALPLAGLAQNTPNDSDLSYTFLEVDYTNLDIDAFDDDDDVIEDFDDGSGWAVNGSFAFSPRFFGFAGYSETDSDATFNDEGTILSESQDTQQFHVGLGLNLPISLGSMPTDFVARAAYVDVDLGDFDFGGSDDPDLDDLNEDSSDGWAADVSLRSQVLSWLEGSLGVGYIDLDDTDSFSVLGNLLFELSPSWGINAAANVGDEVSTYSIGVRYSFDRF